MDNLREAKLYPSTRPKVWPTKLRGNGTGIEYSACITTRQSELIISGSVSNWHKSSKHKKMEICDIYNYCGQADHFVYDNDSLPGHDETR